MSHNPNYASTSAAGRLWNTTSDVDDQEIDYMQQLQLGTDMDLDDGNAMITTAMDDSTHGPSTTQHIPVLSMLPPDFTLPPDLMPRSEYNVTQPFASSTFSNRYSASSDAPFYSSASPTAHQTHDGHTMGPQFYGGNEAFHPSFPAAQPSPSTLTTTTPASGAHAPQSQRPPPVPGGSGEQPSSVPGLYSQPQRFSGSSLDSSFSAASSTSHSDRARGKNRSTRIFGPIPRRGSPNMPPPASPRSGVSSRGSMMSIEIQELHRLRAERDKFAIDHQRQHEIREMRNRLTPGSAYPSFSDWVNTKKPVHPVDPTHRDKPSPQYAFLRLHMDDAFTTTDYRSWRSTARRLLLTHIPRDYPLPTHFDYLPIDITDKVGDELAVRYPQFGACHDNWKANYFIGGDKRWPKTKSWMLVAQPGRVTVKAATVTESKGKGKGKGKGTRKADDTDCDDSDSPAPEPDDPDESQSDDNQGRVSDDGQSQASDGSLSQVSSYMGMSDQTTTGWGRRESPGRSSSASSKKRKQFGNTTADAHSGQESRSSRKGKDRAHTTTLKLSSNPLTPSSFSTTVPFPVALPAALQTAHPTTSITAPSSPARSSEVFSTQPARSSPLPPSAPPSSAPRLPAPPPFWPSQSMGHTSGPPATSHSATSDSLRPSLFARNLPIRGPPPTTPPRVSNASLPAPSASSSNVTMPSTTATVVGPSMLDDYLDNNNLPSIGDFHWCREDFVVSGDDNTKNYEPEIGVTPMISCKRRWAEQFQQIYKRAPTSGEVTQWWKSLSKERRTVRALPPDAPRHRRGLVFLLKSFLKSLSKADKKQLE